jgi:site-specific recombinase XerD
MFFLDFYGKSGKRELREMERVDLEAFIEHEQDRGLRISTVRTRLACIIAFLHFLMEQDIVAGSLLKRSIKLKLPDVLPRAINPSDVRKLLCVMDDIRDRAMFMLMLRCGLRVQEVAELTVDAIEYQRRQIFVFHGKGAKDRVVYMSEDARSALLAYLAKRSSKARGLFLVQKGPMRGKPLSVRGIQKRIEYYARNNNLNVSCHRLRHTMATQLLNADADLATIQDLLGHGQITTTQRYCRIANLKVQRDYYKAIEVVLQRMQAQQEDDEEEESMEFHGDAENELS